MKLANLRSGYHENNSIFDRNSALNRDNIFGPYIKLKESFKEFGIILNTPDVNKGKNVEFEIHLDYQDETSSNLNFLLLYENPEIYPLNHLDNLTKYRKIFTWNDDLVDEEKFIKIFIPNTLPKNSIFKSFFEKDTFCSIIASHRTLPRYVKNNLYKERLRDVTWFDKYHPEVIKVYGDRWDSSSLPHILNKRPFRLLFNKYYKLTGTHQFKTYQGKLAAKSEALNNSKFSLCYENLSGLNGYITEKIFDCFFYGCIPIYWGAKNINFYIPVNCFIDRREFNSNQDLFNYINSISHIEYNDYQKNIALFLKSKEINKFSSDWFAMKITDTIKNELSGK